jgi:hypothetical protein
MGRAGSASQMPSVPLRHPSLRAAGAERRRHQGGSTFRGGEETEPVVLALSVAGTRQHWRPSLKPMPLLLAEGVNMEAC